MGLGFFLLIPKTGHHSASTRFFSASAAAGSEAMLPRRPHPLHEWGQGKSLGGVLHR